MPSAFKDAESNARGEQTGGQNATTAELPFLVTQWLANYGEESPTAGVQDQHREEAINRIRRASSEIASAFSALGAYGVANRSLLQQGHSTSTQTSSIGAFSDQRNATYSDVARRWPGLSASHLETVIESNASNTVALLTSAERNVPTSSLVDSAYESTSKESSSDGGRRLGDANEASRRETIIPPAVSALHLTTLMAALPDRAAMPAPKDVDGSEKEGSLPHQRVAVPVESDFSRISKQSALCTRRLLSLRDKCREEEREILQLQRSINIENEVRSGLLIERDLVSSEKMETTSITQGDAPHSLLTRTSLATASKELSDKLAAIKTREDTCEMVVTRLTRKLTDLVDSRGKRKDEVRRALEEAESSYRNAISLRQKYLDPFQQSATSTLPVPVMHCGPNNNSILAGITTRQYGGGGSWRQTIPARRLLGRSPSQKAASLVRKAVLSSRLSHAVTINCHLSYPVYCQCFDRTGRYFMTGADDYLVKLFYLGAAQSCDSKRGDDSGQQPRSNYGANTRGAVLVCTLRGHAGVICDIDVSMDNALLATASDDGDCRIWGLRDGCPVAILRGHSGGANMVSWSSLSPYRLATIGSDGLARMWDVREAALKRYGAHVGTRVDYLLPLTDSEKEAIQEEPTSDTAIQYIRSEASASETVDLPPLPEPDNESRVLDAVVGNNASQAPREVPGMIVPPLPPGAGPIGHEINGGSIQNEAGVNARNEIVEGAFVANDAVDEGVRLIAKLQHGDAVGGQQGPSTRSNRNSNKIICVARCPLGGHFVTGSEDGLGRIWADEDDDRLSYMDQKYANCMRGRCRMEMKGRKGTRKSARVNSLRLHFRDADAPSTSRLLATLAGHVNAITDLQYSHAGDRILTASQRDGVVRVWSWGSESASGEHAALSSTSVSNTGGNKFSDLKQVLIRLSHPTAGAGTSTVGTQSSRRRGGTASSASSVSKSLCDVAVWTSDDSKIVTSQCCLAQATGSNIVPGSQFLLVWDSQTGQCLMGIAEAHTEICSVLVPHPTDPSVLCSAGADGRINLWDLASGKRMLTHQNTVDHGPDEPQSDRGKKSGYLDGSFSPDGNTLVLTDDSGRVTLFDSLVPTSIERSLQVISNVASSVRDAQRSVPFWMKEQYFANDYYELYYDANGYCIERGSQQPPFLAPRAARCSNSGVPYSEEISRAFRSLVGPLPLPEQDCRWQRESIRNSAKKVRRFAGPLLQNVQDKRAVVMGEYDDNKTLIIYCLGDKISVPGALREVGSRSTIRQPGSIQRSGSQPVSQSNTSASGRPLSSNYRWRDYDDVLREEEGNEGDGDTDDEEFVEPARRMGAHYESSDDSIRDLLDEELSDEDSMSERRISRRVNGSSTRRVQSARSRRVNRRSRTREHSVAYERRSMSQPTRVSARQLLSEAKRPYAEPDSDEDLAEYLSTNNTPSGPYVEDYTVARHYFKMPKNAIVWNKWLLRLESKSSYIGTKDYAPQVGDSVVYIPRAHYDTIQQFPTLHPPWKKWPTNAAWPVVRCLVRDIRYRFPYEDYYRGNHNAKVMSVVAILTLEVTGIPEISQDRWFPWPKPFFILRQTRSSSLSFEVSLFQGSQADFVVPEQLYLWRLETLEAAIIDKDHVIEGLPVVSYYAPDTSIEGEDADLHPYNARLIDKTTPSGHGNDLHIRGSGYESLKLKWDSGGDGDISPWEVVVKSKGAEFLQPPRMNQTEKNCIMDLLNNVARRQDAQEWFMRPVDVVRYSDYLSRVEVPIDFGFIQTRLEKDYYTNSLSVLSDVRLIRDNCIKYNDIRSELSKSAIEIYEFVEKEINKMEHAPASPSRVIQHHSSQVAPRDSEQEPDIVQRSSSRLRSRRAGTQRRMPNGNAAASSLERLPPPVVPDELDSSSQNGNRGTNAFERSRVTRSRRNIDSRDGTRGSVSVGRMTRSSTTPAVAGSHMSEASESEDNSLSKGDRHSEEPTSEGEQSSEEDDDGTSESFVNSDDNSDHSANDEIAVPTRRSSRRHASLRQKRHVASNRKRRPRSSNSATATDNGTPRRSTRAWTEHNASDRKRRARTSNSAIATDNGTPRRPTRARTEHKQAKEVSYSSPDESGRGTVLSRRSPRLHASPQPRSSPRRRRARCSYAEVESDDSGLTEISTSASRREQYEEDSAEVSDSEVSVEEIRRPKASPKRQRGKSRPKRRAGTEPKKPEAKKRRVSKQQQMERNLPELKEWPQIDMKDITGVAKAVMERMMAADGEDIFAVPVKETFPNIANDYHDIVPNPMDYRTIVEDRIQRYQSISELQEDLILVFRNCTDYNNPGSYFWKYAITMWEMLNDTFREVCRELQVLLPRRW